LRKTNTNTQLDRCVGETLAATGAIGPGATISTIAIALNIMVSKRNVTQNEMSPELPQLP
jgi:hypothetical protein